MSGVSSQPILVSEANELGGPIRTGARKSRLFAIFLFELRQRLRRISTYVYFVVFAVLGCLFTLLSGGAFPGGSVEFGTGGKVLVNSPYALNSIITYISFFGIVITAAIAGQATYQDIDSKSTCSSTPHPFPSLITSGDGFSQPSCCKSSSSAASVWARGLAR
jgi:hypothetical protein